MTVLRRDRRTVTGSLGLGVQIERVPELRIPIIFTGMSFFEKRLLENRLQEYSVELESAQTSKIPLYIVP